MSIVIEKLSYFGAVQHSLEHLSGVAVFFGQVGNRIPLDDCEKGGCGLALPHDL